MINAEALNRYGILESIFSGTESQRDIATTCREDSTNSLPLRVTGPAGLSNRQADEAEKHFQFLYEVAINGL
jgi:hypothetical protein